ncbi:CCA tRNA nucleotidyltransferase [Deinococcus sp. SDU3-2]|uniref:CCA tRNA nucleotidyltransferase n=1 Tax=Deinococcus terrestris TaxID=2651870 RepID=A0A7X1NZ08_9DEIO|nr:HDIG domain-containing metalloprotein [Deinococcus terrestris]MPY68407.1 CCA tRNA nucleotidyltransferase [Deinococcus terrestris]
MFRRPPLPPFPEGGLLVGGAARDWLRGAAPHDYDWAVLDPAEAARTLAAKAGGSAFALDEERGYWRVHAPGGVQHDFVPLPGDLTDDLLRRDFTVNALALTSERRVVDPSGGQADLRARRLRMVSEANLRADPLRAWRAVRFGVTLGFRLEASTEAAVRRVADALAAGTLLLPAAERVRDELEALLSHPDAARGILRLEDLGLLALTLPELREGIGMVQGGFHHLDVFHHGVEALHQLLARFPDADPALRWATLLHDVGKPRTRGTNPRSGRTTFYGHDRVGAELAREMLTRLRLPSATVDRAGTLVRAHMAQLPANEREARRFVHRRRPLLPDLLRLMLADREASRGPDSHPAIRHAYMRAIDRVLAALEEQPQAPRPLLTGEDVMVLLDLSPGPAVGEALRAVAEAQALGEVRTPEEARAFLQAQRAEDSAPR